MRHTQTELKRSVISVLAYFDFFQYPITTDELYRFFPYKTSIQEVKKTTNSMAKNRKIESIKYQGEEYYTILGHGINLRKRISRKSITTRKINKISTFVKLISFFSQIKLLGISGSCAMDNAQEKDDVDFFIITEKDRLWTARFMSLIIAQIIGKRRRKGQTKIRDRVCLNLFFDESGMSIPKYKRNIYTAHEVVQMKPLLVRDGVYEKFLSKNKWIIYYFPNIKIKSPANNTSIKANPSFLERFLKALQIFIMKKSITSEIITDTQLWFFPVDFQTRILKKKGTYLS